MDAEKLSNEGIDEQYLAWAREDPAGLFFDFLEHLRDNGYTVFQSNNPGVWKPAEIPVVITRDGGGISLNAGIRETLLNGGKEAVFPSISAAKDFIYQHDMGDISGLKIEPK
jgi:hypothetical protein